MAVTITLSGTYADPETGPLPGITLHFTSMYNSRQTQRQSRVSTTTDENAFYTISLVPNIYSVCEVNASGRRKQLGEIHLFADSKPGTLNEYLVSLQPERAQPDILAEMGELLEETKAAAAKAGVNPRGAWDADSEYLANDLVQHDGSEYRATAPVAGTEPPAAPWELFLARGEQGERGKTGEKGPSNVLSIGEVTTVDAETPAAAEITGESPAQVLNLCLPRGRDGSKGKDGKDGEPGPANVLTIGAVITSEPGTLAAAEITGDAPVQVLNLTLPRGDNGKDGQDGENGRDGDPGPANMLQIGTVKTLPAGSDAAAEIIGDSPEQTLNLSLPQGEKGEQGETGPANTLTIGNITTLEPGSDATAEITGDAPAQVLNIGIPQGKDGEKGETGDAGPANVLTVGNVEELPAGSTPTVEITGEAPEQVLNFGFPKIEGGGGMDVVTIPSGESFDPLIAEPGIYVLETGATLLHGPASGLVAIYTCAVMVRASDSVRLTVTGHFNETSGYNHAGEWELMQVGAHWSWASTGPNTGIPKASANFVVQGAQAFFSLDADSLISTRRLVTMVGAKMYGLLSEEQDQALRKLIEQLVADMGA